MAVTGSLRHGQQRHTALPSAAHPIARPRVTTGTHGDRHHRGVSGHDSSTAHSSYWRRPLLVGAYFAYRVDGRAALWIPLAVAGAGCLVAYAW